MRVQGFQAGRKDSGAIEVIGWSQLPLEKWTLFQDRAGGPSQGKSMRKVATVRGAATVPAAFPAVKAKAYPGVHRFTSGCPGFVVATSGHTPTTGVTRGGWGQAGVQPRCPQVAQSTACAPGPDYKPIFKGSLWFLFFISLSFFSPIGTKTN